MARSTKTGWLGGVLAATLHAACARSTPAAGGGPAGTVPPEATKVAGELRDRVLGSSGAEGIARSLSDEVGPRLSGSPGDAAAVRWALAKMAEKGLTNVHAEAARVPHWKRGPEWGELVGPSPQRLALTALGGSVATPEGGLEGDVVEFASLEALEAATRERLGGKIAFVYVRMERRHDGAGYGKAVPARGRAASAAAKAGAIAALVRSIGTDDNRLPHTGALRYEEGVPKIPAAALSAPDADLLHRLGEAGRPLRVRLVAGGEELPEADSANVVGEVRGSDRGDEIVLLGAHLDSWDLGTGAIDDGAGCGIVLDAARRIAMLPQPPRRTVRVVLFANEEHGLEGGKAYAETHKAEAEHTVAAIEADLGAGRAFGVRYLGDPEALPRFQAVAAFLEPMGITADADGAHGGADISPLRALGVPMIDVRQDASRYRGPTAGRSTAGPDPDHGSKCTIGRGRRTAPLAPAGPGVANVHAA